MVRWALWERLGSNGRQEKRHLIIIDNCLHKSFWSAELQATKNVSIKMKVCNTLFTFTCKKWTSLTTSVFFVIGKLIRFFTTL